MTTSASIDAVKPVDRQRFRSFVLAVDADQYGRPDPFGDLTQDQLDRYYGALCAAASPVAVATEFGVALRSDAVLPDQAAGIENVIDTAARQCDFGVPPAPILSAARGWAVRAMTHDLLGHRKAMSERAGEPVAATALAPSPVPSAPPMARQLCKQLSKLERVTVAGLVKWVVAAEMLPAWADDRDAYAVSLILDTCPLGPAMLDRFEVGLAGG
jgi:hypothetical protein